MGPGVDPHSYRAREHDVHLLAQADLILYHGLHLEGKMGELFSALEKQGACVAAVTRSLPRQDLRASPFADIYDPHVWHDVDLWCQVVREIAHIVVALDARHAAYYQENLTRYLNELVALDAYIREQVATIEPERRILVTAHDAFAYFGRAYGFTVVGLQGISTDAEVGTKDLQRLISFIITHSITALFLESSVLPRSLLAVEKAVTARGLPLQIVAELYSDSLGNIDTNASSYSGMVKHNVDTIVAALSSTQVQPC